MTEDDVVAALESPDDFSEQGRALALQMEALTTGKPWPVVMCALVSLSACTIIEQTQGSQELTEAGFALFMKQMREVAEDLNYGSPAAG